LTFSGNAEGVRVPEALPFGARLNIELRASAALAAREILRFVRQRNRVFGALGQPIIFWLLFSAGLGPSFRMPSAEPGAGTSYAEYFFPGTIVLILLFTAIFATISIIEDRREGFLQSVLVAPIPRWSMVLGKIAGSSLIALVQGLLFLALGLTLGLRFSFASLAAVTTLMFLLSLALTGLGFLIAWRMDSTQGFHAVMSVFLLPMWLLSGAFFPAQGGWLGWVLALNPLTYGVAELRRLLYLPRGDEAVAMLAGLPSPGVCWGVTIAFAVITFALSCKIAGTRTTGDLL
jgi:ABC-2 type transport system permease protein